MLGVLIFLGVVFVFCGAQEHPSSLQGFLGPPEMSKVDPDKPLVDQTRVVELAGRYFRVPLMYIDGRPVPGEHQESMLLEVIWPEMRSLWELKDRSEYEKIRKDEHRVGWILLHPEQSRPSLREQNENGERYLTRIEPAASFDGLTKKLWYRGPKANPRLWAEVYIEQDSNGKLKSFIRCTRASSARFPSCAHKFVDGGLLYEISYNEDQFLRSWREQRERAIKFVNSFVINQ